MDSTTEELLLQKLEELILDEEKIVTILSASELLKVSIQDASKLLHAFSEEQKTTQTKVIPTYILSGVLKDGSLGVRLVKQYELQDKRELFSTISNEVLYSLQKSDSVDIHNVALVNGFDASEVKEKPIAGILTSKNCVVRTTKTKPLPKVESKPTIKGKSSFFIKTARVENTDSKHDTTEPLKEEAKEKCSIITKTVSSGAEDRNTKENKKYDIKQILKPKTNGGIASFFNKIPSNTPKSQKNCSSESQTSLESNENKPPSEDQEDVNIEELLTESTDVDSDKIVSTQESQECKVMENVKSSTNKRQRSTSKKSDKPSKRRKRIKEVVKSDSDSDDDMFADNAEETFEDIIKDSDDEQTVVKHKIESPPPVKNKRRKLVDKTYTDEEGFIITSKEWVYESASEDETEQNSALTSEQELKTDVIVPSKMKKELSPSPVGNKGKKGKKNSATNQPTLMSFFKKA